MQYRVSAEFSAEFPPLARLPLTAVAEDNPYKEEIEAWSSYATYLYEFAMALGMVRQIVQRTVKDEAARAKIVKALHALYEAAKGVQQAFLDGIEDMKAGRKPEYHFDPVPVPPWPDPDHPQGFFMSIWNFARPILEQVLAKLAAGSPFATAMAGLINCGDEVFKILDGANLPLTLPQG
jgi:hypothetical protein